MDKRTCEHEEIPDANESSCTTDKLGDEQDGWVYVCGVSNEKHTVLTSAFILCKVELPQMPSTGDASMMSLWMILMIGAASALASLLSKKRSMTR